MLIAHILEDLGVQIQAILRRDRAVGRVHQTG